MPRQKSIPGEEDVTIVFSAVESINWFLKRKVALFNPHSNGLDVFFNVEVCLFLLHDD
jgi:hypothetical protein